MIVKELTVVDPKGDPFFINAMNFYHNGQLPFAEYFKKLSPKDMPPRGAYKKWLDNNPHLNGYRDYYRKVVSSDRGNNYIMPLID